LKEALNILRELATFSNQYIIILCLVQRLQKFEIQVSGGMMVFASRTKVCKCQNS